MTALFHPNKSYPCDYEGGFYVELIGEVINIAHGFSDEVEVTVHVTEHGIMSGWIWEKYAPKIGYQATIRVYDSGGGWYPDNRIVGWSPTPIK